MKKTKQASVAEYSSPKITKAVAQASSSGWQELNLFACGVQDNDLRKLLGEPGVNRLRILYLERNRLSTLPAELGHLSRLTHLNLESNQLSTLPPEIGRLAALRELNLNGNQLSTLPPEIGRLTALTDLDLAGNQLSALPPEIGQLTALTHVDLESNLLSTLPPDIGRLTTLTELNLENNDLSTLPPEIDRLSALTSLFLDKNDRLGIPPEILGPTCIKVLTREDESAAPTAILDYYFRTQIVATRPLNEAKLVLIGDGEVGKTALVNLLVHKKKCTGRERQTQRIEIVPWRIERKKGQAIRLNVWDFGGQEIMHATHQFFITERTLYLVVIDARRGVNESRLDYWLKLVESLAKNSPVIVVVNKIDEQPLKLDENTLRGKYGANVRDFAYVSCENGEGDEDLQQKIRHHVLGLEHVDAKIPAGWIGVKEKLGTTKRSWLTYAEYQEICRKHGVNDPEDQMQLIRFLHDLGVMLSFFHENLEETQVLAPEWVTRGVYAIITSQRLAETNGVLRRSDLAALLPPKDYPPAQRQFIVDMMRKFELCFPMGDGGGAHGGEDAWLIPGLLDERRPPAAALPLGALRFQYKYHVLPASVISRFIVRTFDQLDQAAKLFWRNGIVLAIEGAKARVIADTEEGRIDIAITGDGVVGRRGALTFVRAQFRAVHAPLSGMEPEERVPLPDHPEIVIPYKMLVDLERDPNAPKPYRWWHGSGFAELDVAKLLNGIETKADRKAKKNRKAKKDLHDAKPLGEVFLSYAHKDIEWRDELMTMLAPVLRGRTLEIWHDGKIKPSQDWRSEIKAALRRAHAGVLLVSKHFLASEFIAKEEQSFLIAAAQKAKVKLSWVLIGDCVWDKEPIATLQALHDIAKPLRALRGNNRDATLKRIAQGILSLARK